jgi:hypothetical protein
VERAHESEKRGRGDVAWQHVLPSSLWLKKEHMSITCFVTDNRGNVSLVRVVGRERAKVVQRGKGKAAESVRGWTQLEFHSLVKS